MCSSDLEDFTRRCSRTILRAKGKKSNDQHVFKNLSVSYCLKSSVFLFHNQSMLTQNKIESRHWSNIFLVIRRLTSIMNDRTRTDTGLNREFIRKR